MQKNEELTFNYSVGMFKEEQFKPILTHGTTSGQWIEFGKVLKHGKTKIAYSSLPISVSALTFGQGPKRGDLPEIVVVWGMENFRKVIKIKPISQNSVALALVDNEGNIIEASLKTINFEDQ